MTHRNATVGELVPDYVVLAGDSVLDKAALARTFLDRQPWYLARNAEEKAKFKRKRGASASNEPSGKRRKRQSTVGYRRNLFHRDCQRGFAIDLWGKTFDFNDIEFAHIVPHEYFYNSRADFVRRTGLYVHDAVQNAVSIVSFSVGQFLHPLGTPFFEMCGEQECISRAAAASPRRR